MTTRDFQQSKVYGAEHILSGILDNSRENHTIQIEGMNLTLPPEGKFSTVEDVQRYVKSVTEMPSVREAFPMRSTVSVRPRRGQRIAHYEAWGPTIAIPENGSRWALRELVVLHELAHHYSPSRQGGSHGPQFVETFIKLLELVMGPEMGLVSRIVFLDNDVKIG